MITKTLNLDSAYQDLFAEIKAVSTAKHAEDSSVRIIDISNIEAFFGSIEEIAALDPKFLRLPLDEPIFEIDANTRKIVVPNDFRANGLSVQNDHLAEIIFFRIDRYFDDMDLGNCNIEINWKMGNKVGKTSRFVMAKDIQPGYVIFGWPIDKEITEKSGTVTFAIEFNKKDGEGKITYCFNTMPITINIKEGLVLDGNVEAVSLDSAVLAILTNSSFGEGDAAVGDVTWLTGNGEGLVAGGGPGGTSFAPQEFQSVINLKTNLRTDPQNPTSNAIDLFAQGYVDSGTDIRYADADNNTIVPTIVSISRGQVPVDRDNLEEGRVYTVGSGPNSHIATEEELADESVMLFTVQDLDPNLIYYVKVDDNAYELADAEDLAAWTTEDPVALYVKVAKITVDEAGSYIIKAQGQKFAEVEDPVTHEYTMQKIGGGDTRSTSVVIVPEVEAPSAISIEIEPFEEDVEGYTFEERENVVFLDSENEAVITAVPEIEYNDGCNVFKYNWLKKTGEDTVFSPVAENTPFIASASNDLLIEAPGQYKVQVINFINGGFAPVVESAIITASLLAGKITSAVAKYKIGSRAFAAIPAAGVQYNSAGSLSSNNVTLKIDEVTVDGQEGELEYQWYKQVLSPELEENWEPIEGATGAEFVITNGEGKFLPVVKNNYNGCVYTYELDSISVDDIAG